jgi:hypothetical protein
MIVSTIVLLGRAAPGSGSDAGGKSAGGKTARTVYTLLGAEQ